MLRSLAFLCLFSMSAYGLSMPLDLPPEVRIIDDEQGAHYYIDQKSVSRDELVQELALRRKIIGNDPLNISVNANCRYFIVADLLEFFKERKVASSYNVQSSAKMQTDPPTFVGYGLLVQDKQLAMSRKILPPEEWSLHGTIQQMHPSKRTAEMPNFTLPPNIK